MNPRNSAESSGSEFVLTRVFDAPRERVFEAWTESERLKHWFGPKGFQMLSCKVDLRPGGLFHYGIGAPDGSVIWGRWAFREIVRPERLVFVGSFSDEMGGVARNPWSSSWPLETLTTLTFAEDGGRTALTLWGVPIDATEAEHRTFADGRASMQQGWTGTLDKLDADLNQA